MTLRASFLRAALLWVATFGVVFMATEARAQAPSKPPVMCHTWAGYSLSQGAAWDDIPYGDWVSLDAGVLGSSHRMAQLIVVNTHASQALFVQFRANGGEATTNMAYVGAGAALTFDLWAVGASTISVQGAGAATTARLMSCWAKP